MTQPSFVVRRLIVHLQWTLFTLLAFVVALLLACPGGTCLVLLL